MIFVFYFLAAVLIVLSFKSLRGGIAYLRFFQTEIAKPISDFTPFVTVVAPCRGLDDGLKENLLALAGQDYPHYEVIFVVDDNADAAVSIIEEVLRGAAKSAKRTKLVVAEKADDCSQKVENLREAILHADEKSEDFVFVDSDVRPSADWLRHLVTPLLNGDVGAATGYRWFISKNPSFASELRSAWNASIASALGPNTSSNFCWGGSMAIRRDVFERLDVRAKWRGTLSDDFTVTRVMKEAGLPIVFVPQALTASIGDCEMAEMLEFTTRQMKITSVYAPPLWLVSLIGSGLFLTVLLTALFITLFSSQNNFAVAFAIATLVLIIIFSTGKSWLRLKAARLVLTEYASELKRQFWTQNALWVIAPALFFYNCLAALFSRRLVWRGITYELKSSTETVIIAD